MNIFVRNNGEEKALVPFYRPWDLLREMDSVAREMWDSWKPLGLDHSLVPHTDVYEEKDRLIIKTELPGIDRKDLDITLEGDRLIVKAERKEEVKEDTKNHTREMYYGQYYRSVTLPYPVKEDKIEATYDNGILELRLPKAEEIKSRKIEIKARTPIGEAKKKQLKPKKQ